MPTSSLNKCIKLLLALYLAVLPLALIGCSSGATTDSDDSSSIETAERVEELEAEVERLQAESEENKSALEESHKDDSENHKDQLQVPISSIDADDMNYEEVVKLFKEAGFSNVETEEHQDLIVAFFASEFGVDNISINGKKSFEADEWFPKDAKVVVSYHTYMPEAKEDDTSLEEKKEESNKTNSVEPNLTVANNSDLAKLLDLGDYEDPFITEFGKKYAGKTLEFDGYINNIWPHVVNGKEQKAHVDIYLYGGDFDPDSVRGPVFIMNNRPKYFDPTPGLENPHDYQNVHIVAKCAGCSESPLGIYLDPIKITARS